MGVSYAHHETQDFINLEGRTYNAKFDTQPFSQGDSRYAFMGTLDGNGPRKGEKCVTKVFKKEFAKHFDQLLPNIYASVLSLIFAERFNSKCIPKFMTTEKKIDFLIPQMVKMYDGAHYKLFGFIPTYRDQSRVRMDEYVTIEPFLEGEYEKFNSNSGYEDHIRDLMPTFSHWTWSISGHQFMVCDLQGIEEDDKFILTDPAVHSLEKIYGITDLGVVGMEMVLASHNCNSLCMQLGLRNPFEDQRELIQPRNRRSTTYSFQLSQEEKRRTLKRQKRYFEILPAVFE